MAKAQPVIEAAEDLIKHELVVIQSFLGYVKGEVIAEASKVNELIDSEWQQHFIKRTIQAPAE